MVNTSGSCAEFPSLSWLAPTVAEAIVGVEKLVADVVADFEVNGEPVPQPFTERGYSGTVLRAYVARAACPFGHAGS